MNQSLCNENKLLTPRSWDHAVKKVSFSLSLVQFSAPFDSEILVYITARYIA